MARRPGPFDLRVGGPVCLVSAARAVQVSPRRRRHREAARLEEEGLLQDRRVRPIADRHFGATRDGLRPLPKFNVVLLS